MPEESKEIARTFLDVNWAQQLGLLRGAGLGALVTLPPATAAGVLGAWLDRADQESAVAGGMLAVVVLVTGSLVGAFWMAQRDAMRDWPAACRHSVWRTCRLGLAIGLPLGTPAAGLCAWLTWRDSHSWCFTLGIGLVVCWLPAAVAALAGYHRGERSARQYLQLAGFGSDVGPQDAPVIQSAAPSEITARDGVEAPSLTCRSESKRINRRGVAGYEKTGSHPSQKGATT